MDSNKKLILAVVVFVVLGVIATSDIDVLEEKSFISTYTEEGVTSKTYYQATVSKSRDPKSVYQEMVDIAVLENGSCCNTNRVFADNRVQLLWSPFVYWVGTTESKSGQVLTAEDALDTAIYEYIALGGQALSGVYEDGDQIVVPIDGMELLDSNTDYSSESNICIKIAKGQYKLEFHNIQSWWCHMHSDEHVKHNTVLGISGSMSTLSQMQVIGTAKSETVVYLYKLDESTGQWESGSFYEFYNIPKLPAET